MNACVAAFKGITIVHGIGIRFSLGLNTIIKQSSK